VPTEDIHSTWEEAAPAMYSGKSNSVHYSPMDAYGLTAVDARPPNCEHPSKPEPTVTICHRGSPASHGIANVFTAVARMAIRSLTLLHAAAERPVHHRTVVLPAIRALAAGVLMLGAGSADGADPSDTPLSVQKVADGDYVHFGQVALPTPDNAGDIANLGIIVGQDAVALVDTGGSVSVGQRLLLAVRRITDKPVRYVINTHEHPDHVFGNAAMPAGVTFVGHHNLPSQLARRGTYYLRSYREQLGEKAVAAVKIISPTLLVDNETTLNVGNKPLRLTAWATAHTDCDLTVLDETTGVLFSGDLVFLQHVPVVDGSIDGWLSVMPRLARLPAKIVVPGHGRVDAPWPQALDDEARYLTVLAQDTRHQIAAGTPLARAVTEIASSERNRWLLFDDYNARNATAAFSELEWR
jgi:quinoprotein relay system zinc metallohydrolase 2